MESLKLLLSIGLTFVVVTNAKNTTGNNSSVEVEHIIKQYVTKVVRYNVDLTLYLNEEDYKHTDFFETIFVRTNVYSTFKEFIHEQREKGNFIFFGESTIFFEDISGKRIISLHAQNLEIDKEATKIVYTVDGIHNVIVPKEHVYHRATQTVDIIFDYPFLRDIDTYRLIMKFVGGVTDNTGGGFVKTISLNDEDEKVWLITAANFLGSGARYIFPCWDEPNIRSTFTISIKHYQNYTALSNMLAIYKSTDDNGMVQTGFETTNKISPYQVAIVLSDLNRIYGTNVWCRQNVEEQMEFAQKIAKDSTMLLKLRFENLTLPLTVSHVVIPGFRDQGVESWGLVLHREAAVLYDKRLDFVTRKFEVARTVARKIAHQYVGNLIGQSSWSYLWLNEGIAAYWAMKILKQFVHPDLMDLLVVQFQHESLRLNDHYNMSLVHEIDAPSDINSIFSFTHYVTAPIFVRSLLQALPDDDVLQIGFDNFLTLYQLRSIDASSNTIDNFIHVLQELLHAPDIYDPKTYINLTRIIPWTKRERYPVLQVTRESSGNKDEIYLTELYPKKLWICVTYTTQGNPDVTETKWLAPDTPILHLGSINKNHWIIVNVQQAGYYRVNYDSHNWQKLGKYLNSTEYLNIHVLNRAQIIDDAYYFLSMNKLDFGLFKTLTYFLSQELNYIAWYPAFKILEQISGFFPFSQSTEVKEHFRILLNLVLRKIGYRDMVNENDFTKCLRQEAAKWACTLNSQECIATAMANLVWLYGYGVPEQEYILLSEWEEWTYCKGLKLANVVTWNMVLNNEVVHNELLEALACSDNHTVIINYIARLMSGYFTDVQQRIVIFHSVIARHAKNNLVLDYILENFANVVPREINTIVALVDIINHLYSKEQFDKISAFTQVNFSPKIFSYIDEKLRTRSLEINKHIGYFESFLNTQRITV